LLVDGFALLEVCPAIDVEDRPQRAEDDRSGDQPRESQYRKPDGDTEDDGRRIQVDLLAGHERSEIVLSQSDDDPSADGEESTSDRLAGRDLVHSRRSQPRNASIIGTKVFTEDTVINRKNTSKKYNSKCRYNKI
jgi:hypothetical protein